MESLLNMFDYPLVVNRVKSTMNTKSRLVGQGNLEPEPQEGNIEYKLKLINPSPGRLEQLVTQMKWRLEEGLGEALYEIGVADNGVLKGLTQDEIEASMQTLHLMAKKIGASVSVIREKVVENSSTTSKKRKAIEVLVRKISEENSMNHNRPDEVRLILIGDAAVGKTSLIGVLTQGELDNGRGSRALPLFRYRHEFRTGRTSSINKELMGFDSNGCVMNYRQYQSQDEICQLSSKIIVFIDSGGLQKYLKTTVRCLTAMHADYAILMVNAATGIEGTTLQHLSLALALELPIIIAINKIDLCNPTETLNSIKELFNTLCMNKSWLVIENDDDISSFWNCSYNHQIVPIFLLSCVNGVGINHLYHFLKMLKPSMSTVDKDRLIKENTIFQVDETFNIQNVGTVVSGYLSSGIIEEGCVLEVGPFDDGKFVDVTVSSVERHRVSRRYVKPGESSTVAIELVASQESNSFCLEKTIRKGMVLLSRSEQNVGSVCSFFKAQIFVMPNSSEISITFQAMVYIENVRQGVTVMAIQEKESVASNESATVVLQFCKHPEYIRPGYRILIQNGATKAVGRVTYIYPHQMP